MIKIPKSSVECKINNLNFKSKDSRISDSNPDDLSPIWKHNKVYGMNNIISWIIRMNKKKHAIYHYELEQVISWIEYFKCQNYFHGFNINYFCPITSNWDIRLFDSERIIYIFDWEIGENWNFRKWFGRSCYLVFWRDKVWTTKFKIEIWTGLFSFSN